jgi:four helix bundle protein
MNEQSFKDHTKRLGLSFIELAEELPKSRTADLIGHQLIRSGTSIGANYRSACRDRSLADVEEEADESIYWLELLLESNLVPYTRVEKLSRETDEIIAMTVASIRTLQKRNTLPPTNRKSKIGNRKLL